MHISDYLMLVGLVLVIVVPFILVFKFWRWLKAKNQPQEVKSRRAKIFFVTLGWILIVVSIVGLQLGNYSFSIGWRNYFWLIFGVHTVWIHTKQKKASITEKLSEDDVKAIKDALGWKFKAGFTLIIIFGILSFRVMQKSDNPWSLLLIVAQIPLFWLLFKINKKKINIVREARGLSKV